MQKKVNNGSFKSISDDWLNFMSGKLRRLLKRRYSHSDADCLFQAGKEGQGFRPKAILPFAGFRFPMRYSVW